MTFAKQDGIAYSRCGHAKASYNGMKAFFEIFAKGPFIMKINCLALFAAKSRNMPDNIRRYNQHQPHEGPLNSTLNNAKRNASVWFH